MTTESVADVGSGLQGQLDTILSLYQVLTNLHFLLVEQRVSTSASAIHSVITSEITHLGRILQNGVKQLSIAHQEKLQLASILIAQTPFIRVVPSGDEVAQGLQILDGILTESVTRARRHARNQKRIQELVTSVQQEDERLKLVIKTLSKIRDRCDSLVLLGREELQSMERAEKHPIPYHEILNYARKLSQTTTAPPGFKLQLEDEEIGLEEVVDGPQASKTLYQDETDVNQGKAGRVPPHLQEKLPFPSENALRRSAMNNPLLTWQDFKRGFQIGEGEEQQLEAQLNGGSAKRTVMQGNHSRGLAEEEDDGFGLDLN